MRIRLIAGLGLGALGIVASACSSSSSGNSNPYQTQSDFCAAVAQAECQETGDNNCSISVSQMQCVTWRTSQCMQGNIILPLANSDTTSRTYTPGNAKACIDALNSAFNQVQIKYTDLFKSGGLVDTCEHVFVGNAGDGSGCHSDYDCTVSGEVCAPILGQATGACAKPTPKMLGEACADPGDECATSTYCAIPSGGSLPKCVASANTGAICSGSNQCVAADYCATGGTSSTCQVRVQSGGACTSTGDCDTNLFCDPDVNQCKGSLGFVSGSPDCNGFLLGQNLPDAGGVTVGDSGGGNDGGTMEAATDAPSGG
jgi:hypothetical protein